MRQVSEKEIARREKEIRELFESLGLGTEAEREAIRSTGEPPVQLDQGSISESEYVLELTNTADPNSSPHKVNS